MRPYIFHTKLGSAPENLLTFLPETAYYDVKMNLYNAIIYGGFAMKTITIRGLNEHLSEKLKQAAKKEAKSINQFVIDSIRKSLGEEKEKKFNVIHHDMDHLFGKWSEHECKQIEKSIHMDRKIDTELWL
jgi:hypothetical protein